MVAFVLYAIYGIDKCWESNWMKPKLSQVSQPSFTDPKTHDAFQT